MTQPPNPPPTSSSPTNASGTGGLAVVGELHTEAMEVIREVRLQAGPSDHIYAAMLSTTTS